MPNALRYGVAQRIRLWGGTASGRRIPSFAVEMRKREITVVADDGLSPLGQRPRKSKPLQRELATGRQAKSRRPLCRYMCSWLQHRTSAVRERSCVHLTIRHGDCGCPVAIVTRVVHLDRPCTLRATCCGTRGDWFHSTKWLRPNLLPLLALCSFAVAGGLRVEERGCCGCVFDGYGQTSSVWVLNAQRFAIVEDESY